MSWLEDFGKMADGKEYGSWSTWMARTMFAAPPGPGGAAWLRRCRPCAPGLSLLVPASAFPQAFYLDLFGAALGAMLVSLKLVEARRARLA